MPRIIPIRDMRNTAKISEMCHAVNEPIFVTKNGYGDMVILSMEAYEEHANRMRIHNAIMEGIEDLENGNVSDCNPFLDELVEKYE